MQAKPNKPVHPKHRRRQPWKKPVVCIECGSRAREVGGNRIYPHRPDLFAKRFWLCECGAYCGCHPQSNHPLGYPAGYDTRKARNRAHDAFDPLWRGKTARFSRRSKAYAWLAARMGISVDNCHIGMMTAEQARQVVRHVDELLEVHPAIAQGSKG